MTTPDRETLVAAIHAATCSDPDCQATSEAERIADALLVGPLAAPPGGGGDGVPEAALSWAREIWGDEAVYCDGDLPGSAAHAPSWHHRDFHQHGPGGDPLPVPAARPGPEGEAVERVRRVARTLALGATPDFTVASNGGASAFTADLVALLAAVDRLTGELASVSEALETDRRYALQLEGQRDEARDLAFRAAFGPEGP